MKKYIKFLMLAVMLTVCGGTTLAQNADKQRLSREQLAEKQARYIAASIALDDNTTARFVTTYCQCQKEIWSLGPRLVKGRGQKAQPKSEAEAEQEIQARFERSQRILEIRQKYYKEYSKFLSQKQIEQVYEQERKAMNRLAKRQGGKKARRR